MSNSYNMGQQWNQSQINFGPLQLDQEYEFGSLPASTNDRQHQMLHQQQSYVPGNTYQYSQQQHPIQNSNAHPSSLTGAFSTPHNQQHSHSRSSSFGAAQSGQNSVNGAYAHSGAYASQAAAAVTNNGTNGPYRPNNAAFTFSPPSSIPMALHNMDVSQGGSPNYLTSSPGPLHESFSPPPTSSQLQQQQSYFNANDNPPGPPLAKRHHGSAFKDEPVVDDLDFEAGQSDAKDKQSKL